MSGIMNRMNLYRRKGLKMLSKEQEEKAMHVLTQKTMLDNFEKEIAFRNFYKALFAVNVYNLPYRIILDYLKNYDKQRGKVELNPCYPAPGYLKEKLLVLPLEDVSIENSPTTNDLNITVISSAKRQQIDKHNRSLRDWNLDTKNGIKQWEYYFAHFLKDADLNQYSTFDYFGRNESKQADQEKINQWKILQKHFRETPTNYMIEEPNCSDYDLSKYTLQEFIIAWSNKGGIYEQI